MKSRPRVRRVTAGIGILILGLAVVAGWLMSRVTPFHSSPEGRRESRLMLVEGNKLISASDFPVSDSPRIELGENSAAVIEAFTLTVPGNPENPWRDPVSLKPIASQQLLERGAAERLLRAERTDESPVLTFLLRAEGDLPVVHFDYIAVDDARTEAVVDFHSFRIDTEGNVNRWTRVSVPIGIWHDTPIRVWLSFLAGDPKRQAFTIDDLTGEWKFQSDEFIAVVSTRDIPKQKTEDDTGLISLGMLVEQTIQQQPGILFHGEAGDSVCFWTDEPGATQPARENLSNPRGRHGYLPEGFDFYRVSDIGPEFKLVSVEYLRLSELKLFAFEISGLPDMPNGREVTNLFDLTIPKVTTANPLETVRRAVEFSEDPKRLDFAGDLDQPKQGLERTYENLTVYELLQAWAKSEGVGLKIVIDHESKTLGVETDNRSWSDKARDWWNARVPEWATF
ncbi:MAG: hypothetical protein ACI8UO_005418 [Verrucomicrobiales bacterium]|jgi:hypothetical protein